MRSAIACGPAFVNLFGGNDRHTFADGPIEDVAVQWRANADLDHTMRVDEALFDCVIERRAVPPDKAEALRPSVDMPVEMHEPQRALAGCQRTQQRQRHRMIAAQRDQMLEAGPPAPRSWRECLGCRRERCGNRRYQRGPAAPSRPKMPGGRRRRAYGSPGGSPPGRTALRAGSRCLDRTGSRRRRWQRRHCVRSTPRKLGRIAKVGTEVMASYLGRP